MIARAPYKTLFLRAGNPARGIIAEWLLRARGKERFESCPLRDEARGEFQAGGILQPKIR